MVGFLAGVVFTGTALAFVAFLLVNVGKDSNKRGLSGRHSAGRAGHELPSSAPPAVLPAVALPRDFDGSVWTAAPADGAKSSPARRPRRPATPGPRVRDVDC